MVEGRGSFSRATRHLFAFVIPGNALVYVWTGPHTWLGSLAALAVPILFGFADAYAAPDRDPPDDTVPPRVFDAMIYALSAAQLAIIATLPFMFRNVPLFSIESAV